VKPGPSGLLHFGRFEALEISAKCPCVPGDHGVRGDLGVVNVFPLRAEAFA